MPEWTRGEYRVTTDASQFDADAIHDYLSRESYWAQGRSRETVIKSIANSVCFGVLHGAEQAGFARVITDKATFAYLADVFIVPAQQGQGLGKWLMECILSHPELQGLRRWSLVTQDAHNLYARHGFTPVLHPERWMERFRA